MKVVWKIIKIIVTIWMWLSGIASAILLGFGLLGAKSLGKTPSDYFNDVGNEEDPQLAYALHGINRLEKLFKKK